MKLFFLSLVITLISSLDFSSVIQIKEISSLAQAGGTNGGGVVRYELSADGKIKMDVKGQPQISELYIFEFWESIVTRFYSMGSDIQILEAFKLFEEPSAIEAQSEGGEVLYLERVLKKKLFYSMPSFYRILSQTIRQVYSQKSDRSHCKEMKYTNDRGNNYSNELELLKTQGLEPIQLAWRENNEQIYFNCSLYGKLGTGIADLRIKKLNQALLILHEAVYLLAARSGLHEDSVQVRYFTNALLYKIDLEVLSASGQIRTMVRRFGLDRFFLSKESKSKEVIKLLHSYESLNEKIKLVSTKTIGGAQSSTGPYRWEGLLAFPLSQAFPLKFFKWEFYNSFTVDLYPNLTPEETFILAGSYLSENYHLDFEQIFILNDNERESWLQVNQDICAKTPLFIDAQTYKIMKPKLEEYCRSKIQ